MTQASEPSRKTLMMVQEGLFAAATYLQALEADLTPIWDVLEARCDAQSAIAYALAELLRQPFKHISREDVFDALIVCCVGGPSCGNDSTELLEGYPKFLEKLRAEGRAGEEMAAAFEILKTKGY